MVAALLFVGSHIHRAHKARIAVQVCGINHLVIVPTIYGQRTGLQVEVAAGSRGGRRVQQGDKLRVDIEVMTLISAHTAVPGAASAGTLNQAVADIRKINVVVVDRGPGGTSAAAVPVVPENAVDNMNLRVGTFVKHTTATDSRVTTECNIVQSGKRLMVIHSATLAGRVAAK